MFVDRVTIFVKGGDGGRGCLSFRRERFVPRGGPDGGNGGRGGSVILRAEDGVDSLAAIAHRKHWRAERGGHGEGGNRTGAAGDDLVIAVPPGTLVRDRDRGNVLRDLDQTGQQVVAAHGGKGGRGNRSFMNPTNRAPREWEPGVEGEERWLALELKVIADVGLVGKPNAGKSTLLSRLSRAQPEIADYPFTTKEPNLGIVQVGADRRLVLADIPGLIEGAHDGAGLGHEFLRHVERTRVLVHLVEPMPTDGTDPVANYQAVRRELQLHDPRLLDRPEIVAVTKAELTDAEQVQTALDRALDDRVLFISAVTGKGLPELVHAMTQALDLPRDTDELSESAAK